MGNSQSKRRHRSDENGVDYNTRGGPSRRDRPRTTHPTGAQRLREDADRLRRTRSQPHSPVGSYTIDNFRRYQPGSPTHSTARQPKEAPQRRDKADIKVISARPVVTDSRRRHQQDRYFNQASKTTRNYGDEDHYNQASKSTGNYNDRDDYNQASKSTGNYGDEEDYNQASKSTGRYGDGHGYNQASKSRGGYGDDDDDDDYNQTSKRPHRYRGW